MYIALRDFKSNGVVYKRGEVVPETIHRASLMLSARRIRHPTADEMRAYLEADAKASAKKAAPKKAEG